MSPFERTRLEKAAADCGFELSPEMAGQGLVFRSAQFPESVTVQSLGNDIFVLHASVPILLPTAAPEGLTVQGWNVLYQVLDKAVAIARTMPDRVADKYHQATSAMPRATETERWVVQRVGQDMFRGALLDFWQGRCALQGWRCQSFCGPLTSSPGPRVIQTKKGWMFSMACCWPHIWMRCSTAAG